MAKQIMQFRYYGEDNQNNQPNTKSNKIKKTNLISGIVFNEYFPISYLKIQTSQEDLKFYLNNSISSVQVGANGIYEIDLDGITILSKINFDKSSLESLISNNGYLIIDIIYEKEN